MVVQTLSAPFKDAQKVCGLSKQHHADINARGVSRIQPVAVLRRMHEVQHKLHAAYSVLRQEAIYQP